MKELIFQGQTGNFVPTLALVHLLSHYGMSEMGTVNPKLMGFTGQWFQFQQGMRFPAAGYVVFGNGWLTVATYSPARPDASLAGNWRDYFAVIEAAIDAIDWLDLHPDGHRRAIFDARGARWVQP